MAANFLGNFMKGDATAVRKKKFAEGTLRYDLFKKAKETLKVIQIDIRPITCTFSCVLLELFISFMSLSYFT